MSQTFGFENLQKSVIEMGKTIRKPDFLTYFRRFSLIEATDSSVTLGVLSNFHKDNLSKKFYSEIKEAIKTELPTLQVVDFVVDDRIEVRPESEVVDCRTFLKQSEKQVKKDQVHGVEVVSGINSRMISDRYSLQNFIVGASSQLAHAACEAVSRKP